jgi:hypothetical protein
MPPISAASLFLFSNFGICEVTINSLLNQLGMDRAISILVNVNTLPKIDLSIEGMRSQQFSVGVFIFLMLGIFIFSSIVYSVVFGKYAPKTLRLGEKIMFGAIIVGVAVAIVFAALQMLSGYLF